LAGDRLFVAEQDRHTAVAECEQRVGNEPGVEWAEDLGSVEVVVLLDADAVEPRPRRERAIDPVARRQPARRAARNADAQMIVRELGCPRRGLDERSPPALSLFESDSRRCDISTSQPLMTLKVPVVIYVFDRFLGLILCGFIGATAAS
jgi:hypothetical protein